MRDPFETIFGSRSAARVLLHLYHYGEIHAKAISDDYGEKSITPYWRVLVRFEEGGLLVSQLRGRTRLFRFDPKSPLANALKDFVGKAYAMIPLRAREILFGKRRRPRRAGKPVNPGMDVPGS